MHAHQADGTGAHQQERRDRIVEDEG